MHATAIKPSPQVLFDFDSLLGSYRNRGLLNVPEVMAVLRRRKDFVYELIEEGKLDAHSVDERERFHRVVTARSVALHLAETALYQGGAYQARVRDLFATWTPEHRRWAIEELIRAGEAK